MTIRITTKLSPAVVERSRIALEPTGSVLNILFVVFTIAVVFRVFEVLRELLASLRSIKDCITKPQVSLIICFPLAMSLRVNAEELPAVLVVFVSVPAFFGKLLKPFGINLDVLRALGRAQRDENDAR
jgi:hypothetical protein